MSSPGVLLVIKENNYQKKTSGMNDINTIEGGYQMSNGAKIALTGRLTDEPKQKDWQGTTIVSFSMAVNTTKKEGDKYISDFYNVTVWGKPGEFILPRVSKGSLVQVYGDLTQRKYTDKNNVERINLDVRASDVMPLTPLKKNNNNYTTAQQPNNEEPF